MTTGPKRGWGKTIVKTSCTLVKGAGTPQEEAKPSAQQEEDKQAEEKKKAEQAHSVAESLFKARNLED